MTEHKYIVLDRDGTLIEDVGYIKDVDRVKILPGVIEGLTLLKYHGYEFIIATNQSGIGRGFLTIGDFCRVQDCLLATLSKSMIKIRNTYTCPHHPSENCWCRKPNPGLILQASEDLRVYPSHFTVIGDKQSDVDLARSVGAKPILLTPHKPKDKSLVWFENFYSAAAYICKEGLSK